MDFYTIGIKDNRNSPPEIYPDFVVGRSKDLMVRGKSFYAIWDNDKGLWSTDEYDVQHLVDESLRARAEEAEAKTGVPYQVRYLRSFANNGWAQFRKYVANISDNSHQLDQKLTFANTEVRKTDYVSKRLPYSLEEGPIDAWDEIVGTLYSPEERAKIEWAIGGVVSGDSKNIQKFLVFYGPAGTGKSTILSIIEKLFAGYTTTFEAKALGAANGSFATEVFKDNPLVAIQHDGDLSKIEDNSRLNSIISHEDMTMNEKYKPSYTSRVNAFLFMGTNKPVKISDAKSGIIRRLIDVNPTGTKLPTNHYNTLMSQIDFELGAIAYHCLEVYRKMGKNYYNGYRPLEMMLQTDVFFNFVEAHYDIFKEQGYTTLRQAYKLYKEFCQDTGIDRVSPQYLVREELRNYFDDFRDRAVIDGENLRSVYTGFNLSRFQSKTTRNEPAFSLVLEETKSIFDSEMALRPAQYANDAGTPKFRWDSVDTILNEIDTGKLHFVKVPDHHIVIDFDKKDANGERDLEANLQAASEWPATYAELSKSGKGVHLHYIYDGDVSKLSNTYAEDIEVKVYKGNASLRRKLTKCNANPVASISSGLPLKEEKVIHKETIQSERGLRSLIERNLRKEIHPGTKPSIDFIYQILEDANKSGLKYDVTDMRPRVIAFANNSTNQSTLCLKIVQMMKFESEEQTDEPSETNEDGPIVFFDIEVYPNLFVICWKKEGTDTFVKMINPSPQDVESLLELKLVGFNNRRYDNHILYARSLGHSIEDLYKISKRIINKHPDAYFREAYNVSYTDIFDFSSKKQSLKKFEIELGLHHMELDIPWDQPVPEELWERVVEYCCNDVAATEATFHARKQDFAARRVLADLSGLTPNATTRVLTSKIIFGNDKRPQDKFVYTDLSEMFPGYEFDYGKSTYKGFTTGEGGFVYSEPGIHYDVALLDVASMHPASIENLNLFGDEYTKKFSELKEARIAIKRRDFDKARAMFDGKLKPYLEDEEDSEALAYALKIAINIVYGLTSASFDNAFRDPRNKDNIVAKRGALFMIDLKEMVEAEGFTVAHIKTDSIKIPNATPEIIEKVIDFGKQYGYDFEHEETYARMCLVNDAVYIAKKADCEKDCWTATGLQFARPYVFKTLFTGEEIEEKDLWETKQVVKGTMYLDFSANKPMWYEGEDTLYHIGKTGLFVPVTEDSASGGTLYKIDPEKETRHHVSGTKDHLWIEVETLHSLDDDSYTIDSTYYDKLADEAVATINKFGDFEEFVGRKEKS